MSYPETLFPRFLVPPDTERIRQGDTTELADALARLFDAVNQEITSRIAALKDLRSMVFSVDGSGSAPATGRIGYAVAPVPGTITGVVMLADAVGSAVIDVQKSTLSAFPTTASICAAAKPTLSAAQVFSDFVLTGWDREFNETDCFNGNLDSASTLTYVTCVLFYRPRVK